MLLALDISQAATGFAVGGPESPSPRTGVWKLPQGPENFDRAIVILRQAIAGLIRFSPSKIETAFIEAPLRMQDANHSADTAFVLYGLSAVAREAVKSHGAEPRLVAVPTWRKTCFGKGYPENPKRCATEFCDRFGWTYETHDAAEAACIWYHGAVNTWPKWSPPPMRARGLG